MSTAHAEAKKLVLTLLEKLESRKDFSKDDLWQLYDEHPRNENLGEECKILNRLIEVLLRANPEMISRLLIINKLLYEVVGYILEMPKAKDNALAELDEKIDQLIKLRARREVDVPIVNLSVGSDPFIFGPVSFHPITDQDRSSSWWQQIENYLGPSSSAFQVVSFARVSSPGDMHTSIDYAGRIVDEALLILRAVAFPIEEKEIPQIGVINDYSNMQGRPYRLHRPVQNPYLEYPSPLVIKLGPPTRPYDLREDLLAQVDPTNLSLLLELIAEQRLKPTETMPSKLITGLRWIGEASKPDATSARFAKLAFALETIIGGEPNDEMLTTRGVTATLAERAAFLVGTSTAHKMQVDSDVRRLYRKRSGIVHGLSQDITGADLTEFAVLVRSVAWSFLRRLEQFNSVDDLQRWVLSERYS